MGKAGFTLQQMLWILATVLVGLVGGYIVDRLHMPAGYMVGAIIATAALNLLTGQVFFPAEIRPVLQVVSGCFLGYTINRQDIRNLKNIIVPALLLIMAMLSLNLGLGFLLSNYCGLNLATALFASAPGGMSDMALIADELGADTVAVSLLQLIRLLSIYLIFPPIFRYLSGKLPAGEGLKTDVPLVVPAIAPVPAETPSSHDQGISSFYRKQGFLTMSPRLVNFGLTLACGTTMGLLLMALKLPAGAMIGAVIGVATLNVTTNRGFCYKKFRPILQVAVGCLIGAQLNQNSVASLNRLLLPAIIQIISLVILTGLAGILLYKLTPLDLKTSLLAVTPGGIQEMSLLAADLHANVTQVLLLHTVRLFSVISIFPTVLRWVTTLW